MVWSDEDDEAGESYTPEQWEEVKPFIDELFVEIDRPNEWLLRLTIEVRGDESGGSGYAFAPGLTEDQEDALLRHVAAELLQSAANGDHRRLELPEESGE